ncbi:MAG: hypothetical protein ACRELA_06715 [Candidatus Rokuibacteriota bacterium]
MNDEGPRGRITLARVLELPEVRAARPRPPRVDLTELVEFCETRLAQVNGSGAEETRLAGKSRARFTL